jgi:hypothetical protein
MSRTAPAAARHKSRHSAAQHRFFLTLAATTALSLGATMAPAWAAAPGTVPEPDGYEELGALVGNHASPNGISADGKTVVGSSVGNAFRWTAADGITGLAPLAPQLMQQVRMVQSLSGSLAILHFAGRQTAALKP